MKAGMARSKGHSKKEIRRLSCSDYERIKVVARRLDMSRPEVEKFVLNRFGCRLTDLTPELVNAVIVRLDRIFIERQAEQAARLAREEAEQAARLAREETEKAERAEIERALIKRIRDERKERVNRSKKEKKYRRLRKEFK
jgi:N-methylhydantoinase A/oxoprolinase/acetone carboxylase beta subunit